MGIGALRIVVPWRGRRKRERHAVSVMPVSVGSGWAAMVVMTVRGGAAGADRRGRARRRGSVIPLRLVLVAHGLQYPPAADRGLCGEIGY